MPDTQGINHLGLSVADLEQTTRFFVEGLGWETSGNDPSYPRIALESFPGVTIEFSPELVGDGPRRHMMCSEPGGLRIEFLWPGTLAGSTQ